MCTGNFEKFLLDQISLIKFFLKKRTRSKAANTKSNQFHRINLTCFLNRRLQYQIRCSYNNLLSELLTYHASNLPPNSDTLLKLSSLASC